MQSLFALNSMNVTISGNQKNNFFVPKDQIRQDAYKPNMQLKMMATNQAKNNFKMGPVARGLTLQSQNRMRINAPQAMMPYADQSFIAQNLTAGQISIDQRSGSTGRAAAAQINMAATIG